MTPPADRGAIVKSRFLGFLIWQSIHSTAIFILSKAFLLSLFTPSPLTPSLSTIPAFLAFQLSLVLFSTSLHAVSSPHPNPPVASPLDLALALLALLFFVSAPHQPLLPDFRRRARVSLCFVLFLAAASLSGFVAVSFLLWKCCPSFALFGPIGFRAFVVGFLYGLHYLYFRRWVLEFPIIQRPLFFSFKMGIPSAFGRALKLSSTGYLLSAVLTVFILNVYKEEIVLGKFITEQMLFFIGTFVVFLCWELSHHLHQVLLTKRFSFAPTKGSAAAETNPSEPLLVALEESTPRSLLQYLAYLDLCMVSEGNVDTWRRAAFFEETGETYKRVVAACLRPLQQLTLNFAESLGTERSESKLYEPFSDFQLCAGCARSAASLTVHSHREDRFGVAQLSDSNAAVISTLLSCLLAVETFMGKKTNIQSPTHLGAAGIRWAALNSGRRDEPVGFMGKRKGGSQYSKAYAMADILRTSLYHIVSNFQNEMLNSSKAGLLEKDWILTSKPLYGTRELLSQKLRLFLEFQAC